ncbi:MAG: hypothetical protein GF409_04465 [Candidatus Omnitrophica bacterium]|nr:hypothetical protein [Candidatus Omnitrophota bacterium]
MEIEFTFISISVAILKLFMIMVAGFLLYYFKLIDDKFTDMLSLLLVRLVFPALIISKTVFHFSFAEYSYWWFLPLCGIIFSLGGMAMGGAVHRLMRLDAPVKEFMSSCGFQNCGYLPMNLILFAFAGAVADRLLVYMFLFTLGFNLIMWSLVPLFLSDRLKSGFHLKVFLNPPVVAIAFSLVWVSLFGKESLPPIVADPLKQLGQAAFPLAMLTLGAYLSRYRAFHPERKLSLVACTVTKLVLFPLLVLGILLMVPLSHDYMFFLFLQAAMPTAVSLVVIGSYTNADNKFLSSSIFYTHLVAIFSIPLWLAIFSFFTG